MWNGDKKQSNVIRDAITNGGLSNIEQIRKAIETTGAIAYTARLAEKETSQAIDALGKLKPSIYLDALVSLARFAVERNF